MEKSETQINETPKTAYQLMLEARIAKLTDRISVGSNARIVAKLQRRLRNITASTDD